MEFFQDKTHWSEEIYQKIDPPADAEGEEAIDQNVNSVYLVLLNITETLKHGRMGT